MGSTPITGIAKLRLNFAKMIVGFMLLNVISEISKFNLLLTIYIVRQLASLMLRTQE